MHITRKSTIEPIYNKPRLEGHRIPISSLIANIDDMGLEEYLEEFDLKDEKEKVRDAIIYCIYQDCEKNYGQFCQGCNKNKEYPGQNLWELAREVYKNNFLEEKEIQKLDRNQL